jgi:hypothetical protein
VIPLLRNVKPSLDFAKNLVTALNELAISRKGATGFLPTNNAVIMNNSIDKFIKRVNGRHKKTDLIIGVLSPLLRGLLKPTSFRGAVIFVGVVVLVKCIFEVDAFFIMKIRAKSRVLLSKSG